jgi:hypothetical protein
MTSLLDEIIIEAGAKVSPGTAKSRVLKTDDGIEWAVDDNGLGTRLTPIAGRRSLTSKPPVTTKQFPPLVDPAVRDQKAQLAAIAADPFVSQMLVTLLASNAIDSGTAANELGRAFPQTAEAVRERVIGAYLEIINRRGSR